MSHQKDRGNGWLNRLRCYLSTIFLGFIFLTSAVKFGSVVDVTGIGFYPLSPFEWVFSPWPPTLLPVLTSVALIVTISASSCFNYQLLRSSLVVLLPIGCLAISSLIGLVNTTETNYALLFLWHIFAVFTFSLAVFIHIIHFPKSKQIFIVCIVASTVYLMVVGLVQVNSGFEDVKEFAAQMAKEEGWSLSAAMLNRLNQTRVFATFTYPNNYAAHLILTIPLVLICIWRWSIAIHPPVVGQVVLTSFTAILSFTMLYLSGSRAALAAIVLAAISVAFMNFSELRQWTRYNRRVSYLLTVCVIIGMISLMILTFQGRTLASGGARIHYYTAATKMFIANPLVGVGLGEFFPWYMRLKPIDAEETRLVHNLFLHFLCQCGIFGGVAAGFFLVHPFRMKLLAKKARIKVESVAVFNAILVGWIAWNYHSLTDFNVQIPGTMLIVASLPLLTFRLDVCKDPPPSNTKSKWVLTFLFILLGVGIGYVSLVRLNGEKAYQMLYYQLQSQTDVQPLVDDTKLTATLLPFSPYPWDLLGKKALIQHNYSLGEHAFREASKRAPHRAAYHAFIAQCLIAEGKIDEAEDSINKALLWYPLKSEFHRIKDYIRSHQ